MDDTERTAKIAELERLRAEARQLEDQLERAAEQPWQASGYYAAYYATAGFVLGMFGAAASLLFNVIGATLFGKHPLELIRVYLTFPLGERALTLSAERRSIRLAPGRGVLPCTWGPAMLLGVPFHMLMTRFASGGAGSATSLGDGFLLLMWLINFYGILIWLQPLLFGGNWIVEQIPIWVAMLTHLSFGVTMGLLYPLGLYKPYRLADGALMSAPVESQTSQQEADLPPRGGLVNERLVFWYFVASLAYLFISMLGGILVALQLVHWNPFQGIEWLAPGRWRMVHTNAIAYGFPGQRLSGGLALGDSPVDAPPGGPPGTLVLHLLSPGRWSCSPRLPGSLWVRPFRTIR
jgi:hypothetical protein